jgi:ABC-type transporter Mla subunit MlaD
MADRKSSPQRLPEAVREAVDRTLQATREGAETTRTRAQDAVDELVKGAEAGAEAVRDRVRGAIEERRPATSDDIRDLRAELRAIVRRLDAIEERLPAPAPAAKRTAGSGAAKRSASGAGKRSAAKRSGSGGAKRSRSR